MPLFSQKCSRENGFHPCSLRRLAAVSLLAGFIFLAGAELSRAATIVLNATDNPNTTSFNSNLHWTGGAAPAAGTNYQTATFRLRTPANTAAIAFAGDSLEIQTGGGELRIKTGATVTVTNLILAGGAILDLTAPNGGNAATLAGGLTLNGTATLQSGIQAGEAANTLTITSLISGVGGFTTVGSFGTIILSASNNFTGGATVNGGTVLVNGVIANSPVTVSAGTLGGNGIIKGAVTNSAGGNLSAGLGGADTSTLTVSNNLFLAGTTLFALNRGGAPTASKISGVNLATLGGTLTVNNVGATLQLGDTFTLFSAASFSGNFSTINLPALTSGLGWSNNVAVNGTLVVVAAPLTGSGTWTNDANGIWSVAANWLGGVIGSGTSSNADFSTINITADRTVTLDSARNIGNLFFGDTTGSQNWFLNSSGGSILTLAINAGSPTLTVNNNSATLNLSLAGTAGLTKAGGGNLILSGTNSYTGAVIAKAGTLTLSGTGGGGAAAALTVGNTAGVPAAVNILSGANVTNSTLTLGGNATAAGAIFQSGGFLTQAAAANVADFRLGGVANGYGYYNFSGGTLTANEIGVGSDLAGSVGVLDMSGGNYVSSGYVTIARGIGSLGALNVFGGTMTLSGVAANSTIGFMWNGSGASFGVLNIFNGGSVTGPNNATFVLNYNPFSSASTAQSGVVNLGGGGLLQIGGVNNSAPAIGTTLFNFNGGTLKATVANANFFPNAISAAYVFGGGAIIDDNGVAITVNEPLLAPAGFGVSSIPLAGGGSNYIGAPFVLISGGSGAGATAIAQVNFAGGQITNLFITSPGSGYANTDTLTVTLNGGGGSGATIGTISFATNVSGGLTKTGAGILTLPTVNTFAGKTTVSNGTLLVNGALAGGAIIANGGTLGGNGSIGGAVTNQAGGTLQPGLGGGDTSTLTLSNNLFLAGTNLFVLNRSSATNASKINGVGALTLGGTLTVTNAGAALQADDSFVLFSATGYAGTFSATNLPSLSAGLAWTNTIALNGTLAVVSSLPPTNAAVTNLPASQIFATSATLNGQVLSTGGQIPNVTIFYGTNDGGTNAPAWTNSLVLGARSGTFNTVAAGLATNTAYYFTASASNAAGISWAAPSKNFTTLAANPSATRVPMLTYHNDNTRAGANPNETLLTLANVNTNTFGKLFSYAVDGYVYSQPLIMTNVTIPNQGVHNVVFIATEHDTVYAFDADSNAGTNGGLLWKTNLGVSALSASGDFGYRYTGAGFPDIVPEVGATGTPVIDPATGTLYVNAFTRDVNAGVTNYVHRIHALDVTTGFEKSFSPVVVAGSVAGAGVESVGGVMTFSAVQHNQRAALTLAGGKLYVAYAGYADTDWYHGWVFAYNATNLALPTNAIFNTTPNATPGAFGANAAEGGIWQGGAGLCADTNNNLFFETGNGSFSQNTNGGDYSDTFLKISTTNGLAVADYFTPYNQAALATTDLDLGSCGPVLLPDSAGSVAHPHLIVGPGKDGTVYLVDRDSMGHFQAGSDSQIVQSVSAAFGANRIWSPPAYFNGRLFFQPSSGVMRAYAMTNGALSTAAVASSGVSFGQYNGGPVVSANGTNNAIVWVMNSAAFNSSGAGVLYAYNATNLATLYNSSQLLSRDNPGAAVKMTTPTVAGGKVYVPAQYALSVFGVQLFLDTPVISPNGGSFANSVLVTLTDASPGAAIYFTLDGTTPTGSSTLYTSPFILNSNALVRAIAIQSGAVSSAIASASFVNTAAPGNGAGLRAEYFSNHTSASPFTGSPVLVQTNPTINFNWGTNGPDATVGKTNFTVRWTGSVQAQFTENYSFITSADDGVRLFINGQLLIDDWTDKTTATLRTNTISLVAQQFYSIALDYYQKTSNASVSLSWSSPSTAPAIVPPTQLYPFTNPPPTVIVTAPVTNSTYTATASVTISADADAPHNPISAVSFYANTVFLGSVSNVPYTVTTTGLAAGSYALTAVATDASGVSSTSAVVNVTVATGSGLPYGLTTNGTVPAYFKMPATSGGALPALLSLTGVFSNTPSMTITNGLIAYSPNTPLWSDGAVKTRFVAVPNNGGVLTPDEQINFTPTGSWTFPAGTVFVKTFELNTDTTNPNIKRRLETRLLVRDSNGQVYGVTYKWRADNSDADLLASSLSENITITNAGGNTVQTWYYPSPSDCLACHTPVANYVLGLSTRQLNGNFNYPATGVTDNQLRTFNRLGLFNPAFNESGITNFAKLSALTNLSASLQERARSYLDANCAQCHQPGGNGITFDARYDTAFGSQNISNYPAALSLGFDNACIVKAKDIWRSMIYQRMNTTNAVTKMPPLARNLVDTNAVQVVTDWINSLPGTPALAPPTITPNGGNYFSSVAITLSAPDTNAVIYYTLDGSLPATNSFRYAGAFSLTSNATIAASAFRTNSNHSVTPSALFFVSPLYFTSAGFLPNKQFQLGFAGVPGSNYVLQATTNFLTWTPVNTNLAVTNVFNLIDSKATNFPYRFYRVLQQ